jgi:hypothetical protein
LDGGSARRKAATCTHRAAQRQNKRIEISISQVGFELTIPVFERAKTVRALDGAATVIDLIKQYRSVILRQKQLRFTILNTVKGIPIKMLVMIVCSDAGYEVLTAVAMKSSIFWDITP